MFTPAGRSSLWSESTVRGWYRKTSADFTFALKFPREITHELRLEWPAAEPLTTELLRHAAELVLRDAGKVV